MVALFGLCRDACSLSVQPDPPAHADERAGRTPECQADVVANDDGSVPTRPAVDARWMALIEGRTTRDEVHAWAAPWVEFDLFEGEPLVETALQSLHGFDLISDDPDRPGMLTHGGDGPFLHSDAEIARGLARWRRHCAEYDADPEDFRARRLDQARKWIAENGKE